MNNLSDREMRGELSALTILAVERRGYSVYYGNVDGKCTVFSVRVCKRITPQFVIPSEARNLLF